MANPGLSELVTTTLRLRGKKLRDNVSKNNALIYFLEKSGNVEEVDGGRTIVEEMDYAENQSFKRYEGYEQLNIQPSNVITAAEFNWKQWAIAVSMSGLEMAQNSGKEAVISLLKSRVKNAERTGMNYLNNDCYSDGTADGGKQIGGLDLLVPETPTNEVGGIDRSTADGTFYRNFEFAAIADGGAATSAANIERYINQILLNTTRQNDKVKVAFLDNDYYSYLWDVANSKQRLQDGELAKLGFTSIRYSGLEVVFDGGYQSGGLSGGGVPTKTGYFINPDYIKLKVHKDRNMVPLETRYAINQDAEVRLIAWMGNMTMSNGFLQGRLYES